jgi:hypothetical protein
MKFSICQVINIVDMNNELISQHVFEHGELESPNIHIGCSVVTHKLGLKEFNIVYDNRSGESSRYKIIDIEYSLISQPVTIRVFLEPITLIVGQHDVGDY